MSPAVSQSPVRERILEVSTRLFADHGFAGASVRSIVEAAGVTKPTLYYHFGSKEGLFTALVDEHLAAWSHALDGILLVDESVVGRLRRIIQTEVDGARDNPDVVRFLIGAFQQTGQGAPAFDARRFHLERVQRLARLMQQGIDAGELRLHDPLDSAMLLLGAVDLRIFASVQEGLPLPPDLAERLLDLILSGVSS